MAESAAARAVAGNSRTSSHVTRATGATTSCAIRMPRDTTEWLATEVDQRHADFAAIIGIDRRRRVRQADPVLDRQSRTRPHLCLEPRGMAISSPVGTSTIAPASMTTSSATAAWRSMPAAPAVI